MASRQDVEGKPSAHAGGDVLFGVALTRDAIARRFWDGAQILLGPAYGAKPPGHDLLFRVRADGRLMPVTEGNVPPPEDGDITVMLGPAPLSAR